MAEEKNHAKGEHLRFSCSCKMSEEKAQDLFGLNAEENEDNTSSEDEEQKDNSQFSRRKPVVQSGDLLDIGNEKDDDDLSDSESESEGSANEDEDEDGNDDLGLSDYEQEQDQDQDDENQNDNQNKKKKKVKPLTKEELEKYREAEKKSGVCYLSRIPRFMQPKKVKELLGRYAEVGRVFLVPEDPKITARRKKERNIRKTNYVEGWVEFKDKKQAKALAEYLNTRQIGGKRKHFFYYDIWNIKYLPKFKWRHLIERMGKIIIILHVRSFSVPVITMYM